MVLTALLVAAVHIWSAEPQTVGSLPHEVCVWQRNWDNSVNVAITQAKPQIAGLCVLGSEIAWRQNHPQIARAKIDYGALRKAGLPVGMVLRVGSSSGPFTPEAEATSLVTGLAVSLVSESKSAGIALREIQIDFDCAESKLDGYRVWFETVSRRIAPVSLTITALPCWLRHAEFSALAKTANGYVLQVHSLERPASADARVTLCDPAAAQRAVEQASRIGVPFRVALPTYGYVAGFNSQGKLLGLSAEGPLLTWPAGVRLRDTRAEPSEMTRLVRRWTSDRPAHLVGIIWYRLPTDQDTLNWRWPTLAAVIAGKLPRPAVRAEARRPESGLMEIDLINDGDADDTLRCVVNAECGVSPILAADALNGFELIHEQPAQVQFRGPPQSLRQRLAPGERKTIGWLRMKEEKEIKVYVVPLEE